MLAIAQCLVYTNSIIMAAETATLPCLQNTSNVLCVWELCGKGEFTHEDAQS